MELLSSRNFDRLPYELEASRRVVEGAGSGASREMEALEALHQVNDRLGMLAPELSRMGTADFQALDAPLTVLRSLAG